MPNMFDHESQDMAGLEIHQFYPLIKVNCYSGLSFFLCSMYVPVCTILYDKPIPVCRSICEKARDSCEPIMNRYGFDWPSSMDCGNFPEFGDFEHICMDKIN